MATTKTYEVVIIGGSYSGLSAAMALGRALRSVLVIDNGTPCNKQTPHSHNFLTQDGKKPAEIAAIAKEQVLKYNTVEFLTDTVVAIDKNENFVIQCKENQWQAKQLILATGVKDTMPEIPGFAACWGISIIHCPYCHGYEVKHQKTGILANGDLAFHYAKLLSNLTRELVIFTNGAPSFTAEQTEKLKQHQIEIIPNQVSEMVHRDGQLEEIVFADNSKYAIGVVYASFGVTQKTDFAQKLGCEMTENGLIKVDTMQKTTVEKVFACGDNSSPFRSVAHAVASGNIAGMLLNNAMVEANF